MIYFLTVNYYSTESIKQLLDSIAVAGQEYGKSYNILIVNNSPEDNSVNDLVQMEPKITVIAAPKNIGFGAGCNLGIQYIYNRNSQALVWLINPDTVVEKIALSYIERCFQVTPSIAILGTRIRTVQGELWFSVGNFNPWLGSLTDKSKTVNYEQFHGEIVKCRWVSGCSLILNLRQFGECPRFDSHYFLYYEDADLCERYHRLNYYIAVTEAILVTHAVSAIVKRNIYNQLRHATYSKLYFLKQHGTNLALFLNIGYLFILGGVILPQNRAAALGRWQGLKDFLFPQKEKI